MRALHFLNTQQANLPGKGRSVDVSPRILGCLVLAIAAAAIAFVWTLLAGYGILIAIAAYSLAGTLALVSAAGIALAFETRMPALPAVRSRTQGDEILATIRTG
jgi:hypothetical protein